MGELSARAQSPDLGVEVDHTQEKLLKHLSIVKWHLDMNPKYESCSKEYLHLPLVCFALPFTHCALTVFIHINNISC